MNEYEQDIADEIRARVWSGFHSLSDVLEMIGYIDQSESDADQRMLEAFARDEFQAKSEAEATWPPITDCERFDAAFESLSERGIVALHYAGGSMSDGLYGVGEALTQSERSEVFGYCFYHEQDLWAALDGCGLLLAYGDIEDTAEGKRAIGGLIKAEFERQGFEVEWDGDEKKRINLPRIVWQRRAA